MFPDLGQMNSLGQAALMHIASIDSKLSELIDVTSQRRPQRFELTDSVTVPASGGATNAQAGSLQGTRIANGKRFLLQRITTTAPVATGACAVYATTSGLPDPGNLREVIAAPTLYANAVANSTLIRGGSTLVAIFNAVPAAGGTCTIRYEGLLFDDTEPHDLTH